MKTRPPVKRVLVYGGVIFVILAALFSRDVSIGKYRYDLLTAEAQHHQLLVELAGYASEDVAEKLEYHLLTAFLRNMEAKYLRQQSGLLLPWQRTDGMSMRAKDPMFLRIKELGIRPRYTLLGGVHPCTPESCPPTLYIEPAGGP